MAEYRLLQFFLEHWGFAREQLLDGVCGATSMLMSARSRCMSAACARCSGREQDPTLRLAGGSVSTGL